jgi:hypothetical protein
MTMPETTQSDLVERLIGGRVGEVMDAAKEAAAEITRLRAHCETMAKALETAERQISAAFGIIHPDDKNLLEGSLESIRQPLAAYRKENAV